MPRATPSSSPAAAAAAAAGQPYPSAGWTRAQKLALFEHVLKNGATKWDGVVPGKTAKQCAEQWKKTLLPHILRTSFAA